MFKWIKKFFETSVTILYEKEEYKVITYNSSYSFNRVDLIGPNEVRLNSFCVEIFNPIMTQKAVKTCKQQIDYLLSL